MRKKIFTILLALAASVGMSWATDPIVIATNTGQSSYTQGSITVSVGNVGDGDGFRLNDDNPASISNSGSSTISKIELVPGWFLNQHANVRANGAQPNSSSEELITFLNVNSNEVTISCSVSIYIKEVRIYFEEAVPVGPIPCTPADLGKVLCTDGSIYATVSEATAASKTAAAVITYVDTENGKALALALADDGEMDWATAKTTAPAHTPAVSGGTWTLASKDDWNNMITAAGSYTALRDGFSAVGGTNMQEDAYWSSTPVDAYAWIFYFAYGGKWVDGYVDDPSYVRACLAFDVPTSGSTPAGALNGAFTINADGDKIVFSRGNLQATTTNLGSTWTWDFAPNQWSLIGNAVANNAINGNKKVSANGTVDLFGWSTAATYYGINESWNVDDYAGDFVDWGALMGTEWRTLSRAEFYYIVYSRTDAYKKRGQATVNGVPGYVLLPDAWTLPSGLSFTNSAGNYTTNQYDGADWTAMESAGAVFLPAAGVREGTDIYQVNLYGWYWASTPNDEDGGKAYYLYFDK